MLFLDTPNWKDAARLVAEVARERGQACAPWTSTRKRQRRRLTAPTSPASMW